MVSIRRTTPCVNASSPSDIYTGSANKDLGSCLDDVKYWLAAHPGKGPIYIKVELKAGFQNNYGMGPSAFDAYVNSHIGSVLYRPADLLGSHATLDEAAKANAWPSRSSLAGKIIMYVIPGTVELNNPTDTLHTDVEYATYLKNLHTAGNIATARITSGATTEPLARITPNNTMVTPNSTKFQLAIS